jgi:hypothetical protein
VIRLDEIEQRLADTDRRLNAYDDLRWLLDKLRRAEQQVALSREALGNGPSGYSTLLARERAEKDVAVAAVRAFVQEAYPALFDHRAAYSDPADQRWQALALRVLHP